MLERGAAVAVIGLGNMGGPMARRLVGAGYEVTGFDLSEDATARAAAAGVVVADNPTAAVVGAAGVVLMLPNSDVVTDVLRTPGLLEASAPGALVIDMSSSEPTRTRALGAECALAGRRMIDAPVSGGVRGAEAGTLTVMVGGATRDVEDARPLLEVFGRVVHAGEIGAGHAVKALNNLMSATHLWATSEAVLAGRRFGLDPAVLLAIVNTSSGRSGSSENKWPNFILPGTYDSGFGLGLMLKDMKIAVHLAEESGVPSPLGAAAVALWEKAAGDLPPTADHTEVARWLERQIGDDG